jgi:hypothetical protein
MRHTNSKLNECIHKLRNSGYSVHSIEHDCFVIYRGGNRPQPLPTFSPSELIHHTKYFISECYCKGAKRGVKTAEHRAARAKERQILSAANNRERFDDIDDYTDIEVSPKHCADIWAYD